MLKAVFMDYCGTITQEQCQPVYEFVKRVSAKSTLTDTHEVVKYWWALVTELENRIRRIVS